MGEGNGGGTVVVGKVDEGGGGAAAAGRVARRSREDGGKGLTLVPDGITVSEADWPSAPQDVEE